MRKETKKDIPVPMRMDEINEGLSRMDTSGTGGVSDTAERVELRLKRNNLHKQSREARRNKL